MLSLVCIKILTLYLNSTHCTNTYTMKPIEIELKLRQVGPLLQFVFKERLKRWLRGVAQRSGSEGWLRGVAQRGGAEGCLREVAPRGVTEEWLRGVAQRSGLEGWLRRVVQRGGSDRWLSRVSQ